MELKNLINKSTLYLGLSLGGLLVLLKWIEYQFIIQDYALEIYGGALAVIFTGLGIWLASKLAKPKTIVIEKEVEVIRPVNDFTFNQQQFDQSGISKRELEVLEYMSHGLSNQEIADKLFVSLNTVKTHAANLFQKLDAKRRTQAIQKGKSLGLIP